MTHRTSRAHRGRAWALSAALLSLTILSCRRPHVSGTVSVDSILKKWSDAGFDTQAVANVEPDQWSAGACSHGPVAGLDVLICEYASLEAAQVGEAKMMSDWEEEAIPTGLVVRTSKTLLALSDRTKADRSGRTIARLAKLLPGE